MYGRASQTSWCSALSTCIRGSDWPVSFLIKSTAQAWADNHMTRWWGQCPETEACLDMYHPPCPTRQFLVYIHSQLVPTSPPKLGISCQAPNRGACCCPKFKNVGCCGSGLWQGNSTCPSKRHMVCTFHVDGKCGLSVWTTNSQLQTPKTWTKQTSGFPTWST